MDDFSGASVNKLKVTLRRAVRSSFLCVCQLEATVRAEASSFFVVCPWLIAGTFAL